ncbi:MAG: bifunctional aspartate kinase/homoserine dehydrogenase I [Bacteroidales bacterium]|jgi:aspartokinase/homoserine dehydrogenase 1|nr:bifunctional aspartate kinase/homoserine dehydrogenase I [Bacteroidales bacterium]
MKVLKFGGTSVGNAENIRRVRQIVENQTDSIVVVVSALGGITDKIQNAAKMAVLGTEYFNTEITSIRERHQETVEALFMGEKREDVKEHVAGLLDEMERIIRGVSMIGELTPKTLDKLLGFGERISSYIIAEFIPAAQWTDSAALIRTDSTYGRAQVNFSVTNRLITSELAGKKGIYLAPGFVSSNSDGDYTTLGRGGSDYTASIYAAALNASVLEIWTDVDGFMTADPRVISKAYVISSLSYAEAMELCHFGAKVVYPPTILPVYKKGIPLLIKNTMNPDAPGSLITESRLNGKDLPIKGISSISNMSLVTVQGLGMVGVAGISVRLFRALADENINVILISQASSENSISIGIDSAGAKAAEKAIHTEFEREIFRGQINKVEIENDLAVVAIVGENMKKSSGIAGKLFHTIGKNGINIIAIAQGASELNISWVVKHSDLRKTLNVVHEAFFLSENIEMNVFLMGIGVVGGNLLQQIQQQQEKLLREKRLKIKLVGVANSRKMLLDREGIAIEHFRERMETEGLPSGLEAFRDAIIGMNIYNSVFVDCTASASVAGLYEELLAANVNIVAANKIAASSEYARYLQLKNIAKKRGVKFLFETNVGAGLPIISTLNDLVNAGDKVQKIEAVLSGTLNFIFNTISKDTPLSRTIRMAKEQGYSEPDPRIDLSGLDVVRKLLILVRESGYPVEKDDVTVSRFIPDELFEGSLDKFWKDVPALDADFEHRREQLEAQGKCWRFVATFDNGAASVGLQEVGKGHPFYDLQGSNNLVMFTTERYHEFPMTIKGYGAGAAVTAAGVFADIIRISNV